MKILFINSLSADYVQDLTYSGLVKTFGVDNIIDYRWNKKYHVPYKKYPKNLGYVKNSLLQTLFRRIDFKTIDYVFIGSCKVDAFQTYVEIAAQIPSSTPVVFIDGGDGSEVGIDLTVYKHPDLYQEAVNTRPFDVVFKREYLIEKRYESNVYPLPMSFNLDRLPLMTSGYKYDISFWAVESHPIRIEALNLLQDKFDCAQNGTVRNQKFSQYKRKGEFYLQELAACKIILNLRGGGWDTMRYWEVPAVSGFMMSQKPGIVIPNNFEHEKEVIFIQDDLSDLIDLADYYLRHDTEREAIAQRGHQKILDYHTDSKRVEYIFDTLRGLGK
jgi:hypothetical protein